MYDNINASITPYNYISNNGHVLMFFDGHFSVILNGSIESDVVVVGAVVVVVRAMVSFSRKAARFPRVTLLPASERRLRSTSP
jgi:hypothetical protein